MTVLTAGHLCVDQTPLLSGHSPGLEPGVLYAVGPLKQQLGGSVANTGGTLAKLGESVEAHACVGSDELGNLCRALLERTLDRTRLTKSELGTSYSIVIEHDSHDRTFWQYEGSNADFDPRTLVIGDDVEMVHVGYPSLLPLLCQQSTALAEAFDSIKATGRTTSLDQAHVADGSVASQVDWQTWFTHTIPHTDVWSPSWDDMSSALGLTEPASAEAMQALAKRMLEWGAAVVQLSAGSLGFVLATASPGRLEQGGSVLGPLAERWADQLIWTPAERIAEPRTTVGAGDALTAGLLRALRLGLDPEAAADYSRTVVGRHLRGESLESLKDGPE